MKLAAISLSFVVPLVITTYLYVGETNFKIDFAQQEMEGITYLRPLSRLLVHVEVFDMAVRRQDGAQSARLEALIETDFRDLLAVDGQLRDSLQTTSSGLSDRGRGASVPTQLQSTWEALKLASSAGDQAYREVADRLVTGLRDLIVQVGDQSKLILDPDLDTYYIMDALLLREPEFIGLLRGLGNDVAALPGDADRLSAEDQARLAGQVALLRFQTDGLETDLRSAYVEARRFSQSTELEPTVTPLSARAIDTTRKVADLVGPQIDRPAFAAAAREAIDAHTALWPTLLDQEQKMLQTRETGDMTRRFRSLALVFASLAFSTVLTVFFARRLARNVRAVAAAAGRVATGDLSSRAPVQGGDEVASMATAFNSMAESLEALVGQVISASEAVTTSATQLNSAADQLAATTTEQSAAVTEASATTEELARASASIADTVDQVAAQTGETRDNLEQAEADIEASSVRTLALAELGTEIGAILTLINDIADQTNLLALNAAIEAARAGEAGRGFEVVAEEVRRLAERSKKSAADIAVIIQGIQSQTEATVMAMEKGGKQMRSGLQLLAEAADGTAQVRLTTQQQRSATAQVVETMEQLSDASREVSATASQIASASAMLATLAANLQRMAKAAGSGGGDQAHPNGLRRHATGAMPAGDDDGADRADDRRARNGLGEWGELDERYDRDEHAGAADPVA